MATKKTSKKKKVTASATPVVAKATKTRKTRVQYTDEEREKIMAAAAERKLTAVQVQKEFGVTPVTYYSWRKKAGKVRKVGAKTSPRGRASHVQMRPGGIIAVDVDQDCLREMVRQMVRDEVGDVIKEAFRK
jgi:transposase-like protein